MIRQDKDFQTQYNKEQTINNFLLDNGFLSAYNPVLIDDPQYQVQGVDLSCNNSKSQPVYIDFKLKNSNKYFTKYESWSVEITKYTGYGVIDGWFVSKRQMTNVYVFLEANSKSLSWSDIDSVDTVRVTKQKLKYKIEKNSGKTIDDIIMIADKMMHENLNECLNASGNFKKRERLSTDLWLTMSMPDAGRPVINLCFNRNFLNDISKKTTITK